MAARRSEPVVPRGVVLYWDSSAILSALFSDGHSKEAMAWARRPGLHLLSTLAWAEVHAVISRIERERALERILVNAARETLDRGPWRRVNASPEWELIRVLSLRSQLRGADLWHLSTAKSLQTELPEVKILSFDTRLRAAARGEGLAS